MKAFVYTYEEIKTLIINYAKISETYIAYRKLGDNKKSFGAQRDEITFHKAAKEAVKRNDRSRCPHTVNQQNIK